MFLVLYSISLILPVAIALIFCVDAVGPLAPAPAPLLRQLPLPGRRSRADAAWILPRTRAAGNVLKLWLFRCVPT